MLYCHAGLDLHPFLNLESEHVEELKLGEEIKEHSKIEDDPCSELEMKKVLPHLSRVTNTFIHVTFDYTFLVEIIPELSVRVNRKTGVMLQL